MRAKLDTSALGRTKWNQYATRFVLGGLITAAAGLVAGHFGPQVGGLFVAFPAIFPAGATLIEKHEKDKKEKKGMDGTVRARQAASVDAAGAAMGSIGLVAFGLVVWQLLSGHRSAVLFAVAVAVWAAVSILLWQIRKRAARLRRKRVRI
jgi:hypothetical protein